jgi:tetratricopeptide (TPR) repeat protein
MGTRPKSGVPSAPPRSRTPLLLPIALIVLAGAIAYANSLHGPFILDDLEAISTNEHIRQLWPLSAALFAEREAPVAGRPVVNFSFALNYAFGEFDVTGYHLVNVAIHVACALVLFGIVRRTAMGGPEGPPLRTSSIAGRVGTSGPTGTALTLFALAVALIFVVHPLQTEAVDYLTQRTELLMALFVLLTLYAAIRGRAQAAWNFAAFVFCCLGVASKESAAVAPVLVGLYDRTFVFDSLSAAWRRRWRLYIALASTWVLLAALIWSGPRSLSTGFHTGVGPWTYLMNQTVLIVRYLRLAVWPRGLVIDYGTPRQLTLGDVWPYALILSVLALLTVVALVRRPRLGFLGAWFFITLAPASSIVPIATWVGAERRMYLPLAAVITLLVLAAVRVAELVQDRRHAMRDSLASTRISIATLAAIVVALGATTMARNRDYESGERLARTVLERWPQGRARHWLGMELLAQGRRDEARATIEQALVDEPRAHYTLGLMDFQDGHYDEAIRHLEAFIEHEPLRIEVVSARETIGKALAATGKLAEAERQFRLVLRMVPSDYDAHGLLGDTLLKEGLTADAAREYEEFLRHRTPTVGALLNYGIALVAADRLDDGAAAFRRAVDIDPQNGAAQRNLARALLDQRKFADALPHAQAAVRLRPDDAQAHDDFGLALAGDHRMEEAVTEFRRAVTLAPNDPDAREHLAAALRSRS